MRKIEHLTLILKVTNKCNLDCPYCYTRSTIHNGQDMEMETFKNAVIKGATAAEHLTLVFHGGEPTLRSYEWYKEALDFVNHIKEITGTNISLSLQTNLTLFDEKKFRLFKARNVGIGFSYDGITNDLTRKNENTILNNFHKLSEKPFKFTLGCICLITKDNYDKLIEIAEHYNNLHMMYDLHLVFNTVTMEDDKANMDINLVIENYKKYIDYIFSKKDYHIPFSLQTYIEYIVKEAKPLCKNIDCRYKWLGIGADGKVMPCGNEWIQKNDNYLFGNINTNSIEELYGCDKYKKYDEKIENKMSICKKCEIFSFCNSGCPAEDFSNMGDVGKHDADMCKFTKEIFKYIEKKLEEPIINNNILAVMK